jgi:hypothetical protein
MARMAWTMPAQAEAEIAVRHSGYQQGVGR